MVPQECSPVSDKTPLDSALHYGDRPNFQDLYLVFFYFAIFLSPYPLSLKKEDWQNVLSLWRLNPHCLLASTFCCLFGGASHVRQPNVLVVWGFFSGQIWARISGICLVLSCQKNSAPSGTGWCISSHWLSYFFVSGLGPALGLGT